MNDYVYLIVPIAGVVVSVAIYACVRRMRR